VELLVSPQSAVSPLLNEDVKDELGLSVVLPPSDDNQLPVVTGGDVCKVSLGEVSMAREQLVKEQKMDPDLSCLFEKSCQQRKVFLYLEGILLNTGCSCVSGLHHFTRRRMTIGV